jgi:hypothetical protein
VETRRGLACDLSHYQLCDASGHGRGAFGDATTSTGGSERLSISLHFHNLAYSLSASSFLLAPISKMQLDFQCLSKRARNTAMIGRGILSSRTLVRGFNGMGSAWLLFNEKFASNMSPHTAPSEGKVSD